ncbi:glycosyltransferase [Oceanicaulis alexandrii]|uniref:glycosyltransferase n=1 Tax=Oceanicaulis alexandrii TaxID=153233 RepID=UPI0003B5766D|nr:glycosyltransferase [Oceanicaulis alexandrii]
MTENTSTAIMVLGMHRSGTSALTRILNLLGADLPGDLMPANAYNKSGYWEPTDVVALNDAWLAKADAAWDAPFLEDDTLHGALPRTAVKTAADTIRTAFGDGHELIAVKDPRCTLYAPTWRQALQHAGYAPAQVLIHRDPAEVAQSLAHRDKFTADEAGLLWAWYSLKALKAFQADGGVVVSYSALRQDWRSVIETVRKGLEVDGLKITQDASARIDEFLKEPRSASDAVFSTDMTKVLDAISDLYGEAEAGAHLADLGALEDEVLRLAGQSRASIVRVRAEGHKQVAKVERERDKARNDQKATEQGLLKELDAARETLEQEKTRLSKERDAAREAFEVQTARLANERDAAREAFTSASALAEKIKTELEQSNHEVQQARDELQVLTTEFIALEDSVHAYQDHAQSLENELQKTQADYVAADSERRALRAEAVRLKAIEDSSIWKATTPVRAVMTRLPGVRNLIRRGLKAAWWTATGQIGARLRARKASQLASQLDASRAPESGASAPSNRSQIKTLNSMLTEEFGDAASYIPELISRYDLAFQSEGQPPIKTVVGDDAARKLAERLAKVAAKRPVASSPDVSIIIPAYNQISYTLACIESVFASNPHASFEILVGDDQSTDGTLAAANVPMDHVRWVRHETNQGFVGNCNLTAEQARGRHVLMLNNDTLVLPDWLDTLVETLDGDPKVGLVGSKLIYPDGRLQEAGGIFWQDGSAWNLGRFDHPRRPEFSYARDVDYISGASIALPRGLWEKLGGFDDIFRPAYAEDADLAFRVRAEGLRTVFQPRSMLIHFEGVSSGTDLASGAKAYQVKNLEQLRDRWSDVLAAHRPNGQQPEREKERGVTKRVLFIDMTTPEPQHDAGSLVAVETMRALQALGYKVTFVPVDNFLWTKAYSAPLQAMGVETIYHPFYSRFEPFITARGAEFDLVIVHRFAAAERVMGALRTHAPQAKIAFMPADLHFLREHREAELADDALAQDSAAQTKLRELAIIRAADAVLPHSDTEIALLDEEAPETPAFKLPLIYDPEPIAAGFHRREGIGFLGGFGHPPNVDAVDWFLSDVWPEVRAQKPDARFVLAGSKMPDRFKALDGKNGVKVLGFVETVDIFFSEVRASVAPLRYGAGAKGKVAASLALGTPCITTPIGAEGMGLTPGVDVLVSEDAKGFVRHILAMLDDENRWNDVRQAGVEFARRETSREVVRARLSDMLAQLKLS